MADLGIVKGNEVALNLDGDKKSRVLQVQLTTDEDIQSVELFRLPGDDQNPADGTRVLVINVGTSLAAVSAADVEVDETLEKGEREIYSTDGETRLAKIRLKADGTIVHNEGTRDTARKDDPIESALADDPTFWNWISAVGSVLAGLGVTVPVPTSLTGKITDGTDEVKIP